jgi:outer membrane protein assembly factor BamD (BamD/ComL family)
VLWLFVFLLAASSACSFASPGEEARASEIQETQQNTALEIRLALSRAADAEEKEKLCLRLIEECPQTEEAEEAYWTLSDLYLDGFAEPREDEARKILEQFLERYPSSPWALHAKSRLLWLCGEEFF